MWDSSARWSSVTVLTIRRYRQLQMPVEDVSALLAAPDERTRARLLQEHLERMYAQLQVG